MRCPSRAFETRFRPPTGQAAALAACGLLPWAGQAAPGDLFASSQGTVNIYEFGPDGTETTFVSGLTNPEALAFQPGVPEPSTGALFGLALGAGFVLRQRRRARD